MSRDASSRTIPTTSEPVLSEVLDFGVLAPEIGTIERRGTVSFEKENSISSPKTPSSRILTLDSFYFALF